MTPLAGTVSVACGVVVSLLFAVLEKIGVGHLPLGFWDMPLDYEYAIYPAATASIVSLILLSFLTPASPQEKWQPFWRPRG